LKIINIETHVLSETLEQSFFFSQWAYHERRICVDKTNSDDGIYDWGKAYGSTDVIRQGIALLEPILIGKNPLENKLLWFEMYRKTSDFT
jgi:D-galactarolactone cycloisomerase